MCLFILTYFPNTCPFLNVVVCRIMQSFSGCTSPKHVFLLWFYCVWWLNPIHQPHTLWVCSVCLVMHPQLQIDYLLCSHQQPWNPACPDMLMILFQQFTHLHIFSWQLVTMRISPIWSVSPISVPFSDVSMSGHPTITNIQQHTVWFICQIIVHIVLVFTHHCSIIGRYSHIHFGSQCFPYNKFH